MSNLFSSVTFFLIIYCVMDSGETIKLFPLNNDVCLEVLQRNGLDISDVKIIHYDLDAKSTLYAGQSPNREVFRLFIDYEKGSQIQNTSFLVKAPISSISYNLMYKYGVYEKEYALYSQVFPEMFKLENQSFSARFIAGEDIKYINTLILEDVYTMGYKTSGLFTPLNLQQCELVFKMLARFHALSIILDKRDLIPEVVKNIPKPENEFEEEDTREDIDKATAYFDQGMDYFVQNLNSEIKEKYDDRLQSMKSNISCKIKEEMDGSFMVLTHGDLMASNLLFKYNEDDIAEDVILMNFIGAKWQSPLVDIFYLTIGSMKFEDVEEHFDSLLKMYVNAMNELFKKYEIDLYTLDDLNNDIRKQHLTFMWICGVILPLISNPQLPVQIDGYSFKEPLNADTMQIAYTSEKYIDAASKWFMFFVKRGVFDD